MTIIRRKFIAGAVASAGVLSMPAILKAETTKVKLSHFLPPKHQINVELTRWAKEIMAVSEGALDISIFPAGQMGPPPRQYDLARTGAADLAFIFTAFSPGRFPITDLLSAPFILADNDGTPMTSADASWIATSLKDEVAGEYVATEMLYSVCSTALGFYMRDKFIKKPADLKGLRIRPTSVAVTNQLKAMGASPATLPPTEVADSIGKGVVDGAVFNFEGGRAFQLHQSVKKVSTLGFSSGTFSFIANTDFLNGLPTELSKLIRDTTGPEAGRRAGKLYDDAEAAGRAFMIDNGVEVVDLRGDDIAEFRKTLAPVYDAQIADLKAKNPDTDAIIAKILALKAEVNS